MCGIRKRVCTSCMKYRKWGIDWCAADLLLRTSGGFDPLFNWLVNLHSGCLACIMQAEGRGGGCDVSQCLRPITVRRVGIRQSRSCARTSFSNTILLLVTRRGYLRSSYTETLTFRDVIWLIDLSTNRPLTFDISFRCEWSKKHRSSFNFKATTDNQINTDRLIGRCNNLLLYRIVHSFLKAAENNSPCLFVPVSCHACCRVHRLCPQTFTSSSRERRDFHSQCWCCVLNY